LLETVYFNVTATPAWHGSRSIRAASNKLSGHVTGLRIYLQNKLTPLFTHIRKDKSYASAESLRAKNLTIFRWVLGPRARPFDEETLQKTLWAGQGRI
jgi:hypothetical protein